MICPNCKNKFKYYKLNAFGGKKEGNIKYFLCPLCNAKLRIDPQTKNILSSWLMGFTYLSICLLAFILDKYIKLSKDSFWNAVIYPGVGILLIFIIVATMEKQKVIIYKSPKELNNNINPTKDNSIIANSKIKKIIKFILIAIIFALILFNA